MHVPVFLSAPLEHRVLKGSISLDLIPKELKSRFGLSIAFSKEAFSSASDSLSENDEEIAGV